MFGLACPLPLLPSRDQLKANHATCMGLDAGVWGASCRGLELPTHRVTILVFRIGQLGHYQEVLGCLVVLVPSVHLKTQKGTRPEGAKDPDRAGRLLAQIDTD
uniref:Uncharacterized protein n=1 Tax=Eutreptiella gymnastica TaxID=73025 RepID=A0A7S1N5R7_9EUGL